MSHSLSSGIVPGEVNIVLRMDMSIRVVVAAKMTLWATVLLNDCVIPYAFVSAIYSTYSIR